MNGCSCSILGPDCARGREIFASAQYVHDIAVGREPFPADDDMALDQAWNAYRALYQEYMAHIGMAVHESRSAQLSYV